MANIVKLTTRDNVELMGDWYHDKTPSPRGVLLLHMMPATRSSWGVLAGFLLQAGFQALAVDFRGHGDSKGGPDGYKSFSEKDHQAKILDVKAAADFLKEKGVKNLSLTGASIGANLALHHLATHPDAKTAVLLSPGLNYKGVETEPLARSIRQGQAVFYVASHDDSYSAQTIKRLYDLTPSGVVKEAAFFENAGHGTTMLEREPLLAPKVLDWLAKNV